jgi:hypothetical protein
MPVRIPSTELFMRMSGYTSIEHSLGGEVAITIDAHILFDKRANTPTSMLQPWSQKDVFRFV